MVRSSRFIFTPPFELIFLEERQTFLVKMSGGAGLPAPKALAKFDKVDVDENVISSELFQPC